MHKIDAPHATTANEFTDGNPSTGIEATELISKWFNTVQRELIAVLTAASIIPNDTNDSQVIQAIQTLLTNKASDITSAYQSAVLAHNNDSAAHSATATASSDTVVKRNPAGSTNFTEGYAGTGNPAVMTQFDFHWHDPGYAILPLGFCVQWGSCEGSEDAWGYRSYPLAFVEALGIVGTGSAGTFGTDVDVQVDLATNTQYKVVNNAYNSGSIRWIAVGRV